MRRLVGRVLRRLARVLAPYGIDLYVVRASLVGRRQYKLDLVAYRRAVGPATDFPEGRRIPMLRDRWHSGGTASGHYFHQDLLVAQWISEANPRRHVDVGSRVDGFVAHVASFREIDVLDIRPLATSASRITFHARDITVVDPSWNACTDSLSCLHSIEHFGLGRYGDTVDPDGWRKGWQQLVHMVEPGGTIYLSTMIGPQRVEFNAHRVFSMPFLLALVEPDCRVIDFAYVDDDGELHVDVDWTAPEAASTFGVDEGCGILRLLRRAAADGPTR